MVGPMNILRSITGSEIEHFEQYGFVRLKQILADGELERLRRATDLALGTFEASPSGCDLTLFAHASDTTSPFLAAPFGSVRDRARIPAGDRSVSAGHYLVDSGVWRRIDLMRDFALNSKLPQMAAELTGAYQMRFYDDQLVVKEPGTAERTAFHQDLSYLHVDGDRGCAFSVFLERARHGLGRLGYVPSSHRWGHVFKPNLLVSPAACAGSEGVQLPDIENAPDSFGVQYVDVEPGDILVHHLLTLHGMEANRGKTPCRALGFCYVDASLRHRGRPGVAIPPAHNPATRDGAEMDGIAQPVAWPRIQSEALAG